MTRNRATHVVGERAGDELLVGVDVGRASATISIPVDASSFEVAAVLDEVERGAVEYLAAHQRKAGRLDDTGVAADGGERL